MESKAKTRAKPKVKQRREYIRVPCYIMQLKDPIRAFDKLVLALIEDHRGEHEVAWPGENRLARELGTTQTSISSSVNKLIRFGLVKVRREKMCSSYRYSEGDTLIALREAWITSGLDSRNRPSDERLACELYRKEAKRILDLAIKTLNKHPIKQLNNDPTKSLNNEPIKLLNRNVHPNNEDQLTKSKRESRDHGTSAADAASAVDSSLRENSPKEETRPKKRERRRFEEDAPEAAFPPVALLAEIQQYLGEDFGTGLSGAGQRFQLGRLSDRLVEVARQEDEELAELADQPRGLDNKPRKERLILALRRLLTAAAEEKVLTFDGLMALNLWYEVFPGWNVSKENDQPEYVTRRQLEDELAMVGEP